MNDDSDWMRLALGQAREAFARGDWPTGAVLVRDGRLLGCGQNRQVSQADLLWHAEPDAIRQAVAAYGRVATHGATLYSTMEPCPMCAGALKLAGITRLVLALRHRTLGRADLGRFTVEAQAALCGHALQVDDGVLQAEALALRRAWGQDVLQAPR